MPALCPRHPKPNIAYSPRHARATPAPVSCSLRAVLLWHGRPARPGARAPGHRYEGDWEDDTMHGDGREQFAKGEVCPASQHACNCGQACAFSWEAMVPAKQRHVTCTSGG
eukprot:gene11357-biopygen9405